MSVESVEYIVIVSPAEAKTPVNVKLPSEEEQLVVVALPSLTSKDKLAVELSHCPPLPVVACVVSLAR